MNMRMYKAALGTKLPILPSSKKDKLKRAIKQAINTFAALILALASLALFSLLPKGYGDKLGIIFISLLSFFLIWYLIVLIKDIRHMLGKTNRHA
jgi:fatty-acid desaturase